MEVEAQGKLNLTFEVLGRRSDGYHEVKTVMQTIGLSRPALPGNTGPLFGSTAIAGSCRERPTSVWTAAKALAQSRGIQPRARISIQKRIPVAMGLGGGSSDAAAALRALNDLWEIGATDEELGAIAAGIGSDVSFFLTGGTALAEGRGEIVSPLPPLPPFNLTLVFPDLAIDDKTRRMYSRITPAHYSDGGITRRLVLQLTAGGFVVQSHPGWHVQRIPGHSRVGIPGPRRDAPSCGRNGADRSCYLCGAGPALFAVPSSETDHRTVAEALQPMGAGVYLVTTTGPISRAAAES